MYHLLVTASKKAWDSNTYKLERKRFCENTEDSIRDKYKHLSPNEINELISYPAFFLYEGNSESAKIGYISRIKETVNFITIEYYFPPDIPHIPFSIVNEMKMDLDILEYEYNRTHWAIKDADLFDHLLKKDCISNAVYSKYTNIPILDETLFKVAVSFPGEKRDYVLKVILELKRKMHRNPIFYDNDYKSQLSIPNLDSILQKVYLESSLIVVFHSGGYNNKEWCGLELRSVKELIKNKMYKNIMFMKFDDTPIIDMLSIDGFIDIKSLSPDDVARLILERLKSMRIFEYSPINPTLNKK